MSVINDLRIGITNQVLDDSAVEALIKDRFYPGELAEEFNPTYPCANFKIMLGRKDIDTDLLNWIPFRIWSWSELSYDEDYTIYDTIETALQREHFDQDSARIFCKETETPLEAHDPVSRLYYLVAGWQARVIQIT